MGGTAAEPRCHFGAHYLTDETQDDSAGFIRALAEAEGREASSAASRVGTEELKPRCLRSWKNAGPG